MKIEKAYKKMLIENPFYGIFLLGLSKIIDNSVETACVRRRGLCCELVINPNYWETQDDIQQMNLLQHEVYHIVFQHMFMYGSFPNKELLNISADCEVDSYLNNLDDSWVVPSLFNMDPKLGVKYYYEHINIPPTPQGGYIYKTKDDHTSWKEDFQNCSEPEKQLIRNQINARIMQAAEQTEKMRGTIPGELVAIVEQLKKLKPRVFDWKSYFRRMLGSVYDINIKKTRRKESIRFPESAGIKHKKKVSIMVAIDTSGSVSNKELQDFFNEITYIFKAGARITLVECDMVINNISEYKGTWNGKIHGRGGTDFQPVINHYNKVSKEYSALVYFTDGDCNLPTNPPRDMIWIITSTGKHQDYPGKTIYIPKEIQDE